MGYKLTWQVDGRIALIDVSDELSNEAMSQMNSDIVEALNGGIKPVHLIFRTNDLKKFPTHLSEVRKAQDYMHHENVGWIILVGAGALLNFVASTVVSLSRMNMKTVATLDEAMETLKKVDTSLVNADA